MRDPTEGFGEWSTDRALDLADINGCEQEIAFAHDMLVLAQRTTAPPTWYSQRLPFMWTMFMTARNADSRALTIWLAETARLLGDLPFDVVAYAVDEAIRTSKHNFMPSVGEIRSVAAPLLAQRALEIDRLGRMLAALADPVTNAAYVERRTQRAARDAHMSRMNGE